MFFAIRPPLAIARPLVQAACWFDAGGRMVRADHLHVTIDILDDADTIDGRTQDALRRIGDAVAAAPFDVALDLAIGSHRSIALRPRRRVAALAYLQSRIAAARQAGGIPGREGYAFNAHMTLGYRDGVPFSRPVAPVSWRVDEFVLIHSHLGKTRHETIGRWRLAGSSPDQPMLF